MVNAEKYTMHGSYGYSHLSDLSLLAPYLFSSSQWYGTIMLFWRLNSSSSGPCFMYAAAGRREIPLIRIDLFLKTMIPSWVATNPWFHQRSMILTLWQTPKSSLPVATKVGPYQSSVSSSLNSTFWGWNNPKKTQLCRCGWLLVPVLFGKCRNTPTHSKNGDICDVICIMISVESEIICINDYTCVYIDMNIIWIIIRSHDAFLSKTIMGASSQRLILL